MVSVEEKAKSGGLINGAHSIILEDMKVLKGMHQDHSGPLVTLPRVESLVYCFPQGHNEQVELCFLIGGNKHVSSNIKTVVENQSIEVQDDLLCTAWEMIVSWVQRQLKQSDTKETVLNYANQLCESIPSPMGESAVDCKSLSKMPNITFTIGKHAFRIR